MIVIPFSLVWCLSSAEGLNPVSAGPLSGWTNDDKVKNNSSLHGKAIFGHVRVTYSGRKLSGRAWHAGTGRYLEGHPGTSSGDRSLWVLARV
ncbi:hypothetical protein PoB_004184900 [Plakobranchus ocellatus]|uniref:Uncharacterized protein n=1 Tax=Plakobranchus ocellatus TaxID=259542 RepID=A0AAV4BAE2_9GAST|nr:hypothetical protein PoB_004184900 [Plakobranchus ocellatus]